MRIPHQLVLPSYEITNLSHQARRLERRTEITGGASHRAGSIPQPSEPHHFHPPHIMNPSGNPVADALIRLGSAAQAAGLPHLVIGGNAVIHHGVPRFTRDVDFLIPDSDRDAWDLLLGSEGYQLYHAAGSFAQYEARPGMGGSPPVDLMCVASATWEKLATAAENETLGDGYRVAWPSPLHLIALKLHAWKGPFRSGKERDWSDIVGLIDKCHIDLLDPAVREIVTRYGGDDALTKLDAI
jgi:hypothetical protein